MLPSFYSAGAIPTSSAAFPAFVDEEAEKLKLVMKLRSAGIRDVAILNALERIPRELFVNHPFNERAFEDIALPIDCGQTISQPSVVGIMTMALHLQPRQRVLEIGTGSGYQTAVLSQLCRMVYTLERYDTLKRQACTRFQTLQLRNITARTGDGYKGWPEAAPFDRILVTAAAPTVPNALLDQLSDKNGIMVLPVGAESGEQHLLRLIKTPTGISEEVLMKTRFVPMVAGIG
jgi:protein-L-isoaspartate(D-aspartate) O-methyltransferase